MRSKDFFSIMAICLLAFAPAVKAWGPTGHRIVGAAAHELLDPTARAEVELILAYSGSVSTAAAWDRACNWPDEVRETPEWEWSAPLHYVNIPRSTRHYSSERDCPDGKCVTGGITRYANELTLPGLSQERRWQALAFLCHFVGDVHQPLHAGFRDDRGANYVDIEYRGEEWNLHRFWDSVVAGEKLEDETGMVSLIASEGLPKRRDTWNPEEVILWTEESHALAVGAAYPEGKVISPEFADEAWQVIQSQWLLASVRLASILNAVLGEADVTPGD